MNRELIDKLVAQAKKELADEHCPDRFGMPTVIPQETFNKKFAELIVKECCVALNPMLRDMIGRGKGAELIKQHFGVE